tara:strand:+ start:134 stop:427 length:294 start_codon:yes stop_codon:yes gene_type:complete
MLPLDVTGEPDDEIPVPAVMLTEVTVPPVESAAGSHSFEVELYFNTSLFEGVVELTFDKESRGMLSVLFEALIVLLVNVSVELADILVAISLVFVET